MVKSNRLLRIVPLLVVMLAFGSCPQERTEMVGAVLPLSGPWAIYGEPIRKGIELAHEQIQAQHQAGEYPMAMTLDVRDSESNPQQADQLMEELFQQGALAVIGGVTSAEALVMAEGLDEHQRVLLSPSASSPSLTGISRYFFRVFPSDFLEGTRMGSFATLKLDLDNAVILAVNTPFARGIGGVFQDEFERYDGEILGEIVYPDEATEYGEYVDQALELDPQALFIADFATETRQILEILEDRGYEGRLLTTSAFASPDAMEAAGSAAEGVALAQTMFDPASEEPQIREFVEAYEEKYDETPGLFAAHGYDAMMILAKAARENRLPSDLWKDLRGVEFTGVTGQIQFNEQGEPGKFPRVYRIEDGKLRDYEEFLEERKQEFQRRRQQLFKDLERLRREREAANNPG